jgi:hypothetical protein
MALSRTRFVAAALAFVALAPPAFADIDQSKLSAILKGYVSGGKVDYEGIRQNCAGLDEYLLSVSKASGDLKMAFYINAYNALVIAALLDNGPALPGKVTDIKGFFDAKKFKVAGKDMTLNDLEGYVRKTYKDARIYFAFNCGAKSCPPLPNTIFSDATIDKTLTDLTQKFLNGTGVKIDDAKKEIQLTKLMDWYKQDFIDSEGSVDAFIKKYLTDPTKKAAYEKAVTDGYKVTYQFYNWVPNAKAEAPAKTAPTAP